MSDRNGGGKGIRGESAYPIFEPGAEQGEPLWRLRPLAEHRRGKHRHHPLVINFIANTKTWQGFKVYAVLDEHADETGRKVSNEGMASLNVQAESFHGE